MRLFKIAFLISLMSFLSFDTCAQYADPSGLSTMKKWQISQVNLGLGFQNDHFNNMSYDDLMGFAKDPSVMARELNGFQEEISTVAIGAVFYASVSLNPLNALSNSYRSDRELRLGLGRQMGREAMLSYKKEEADTSIVYCNIQNELSIEGAYIYKKKLGKKFEYYYGYGMNIGTTFNNQMMLISGKYFGPDDHPSTQESDKNSVETYEAKPVSYSRIYIPYGINYAFSKGKWLLGFDFRTGIGVQKIKGQEANFIKKTGSFVLGLTYRVPRL